MAQAASEQAARLRTVETTPAEPIPLAVVTSAGKDVDPAAGLMRLFKVEDRLRASRSRSEYAHALANELLALVGARQIVVFSRRNSGWKTKSAGGRWSAICLSGLAGVERDAPLVRALETFVARRATQTDPSRTASGDAADAGALRCLPLCAVRKTDRELVAKYPFREAAWLPLCLRDGTCFAGLLLLRAHPWSADDLTLLERQAPMIADTWTAIEGPARLRPTPRRHRFFAFVLAAAAIAALALPVPMTTLAPVEIVAQAPQLVTAPINGVIADVHVRENTMIARGDKLLSYVDTELRNVYVLAAREADVAIASHERLRQAAFSDEASRHQLSIAETEMKLRIAERDYAWERLGEVDVRAERDGIVMFPGRDALLGKPVATGQELMRIADPTRIGAEARVPVSDAIVLRRDGSARLFLDAAPLAPRGAMVESGGYHAEPDATGTLVYTIRLRLDETDAGADEPTNTDDAARKEGRPRIGARGTAQLFGDTVSLGFFLFRRPIAWARQRFGL